MAERQGSGRGGPLLPAEEVASAVLARKELGAEMEPAVVEAFLDRVSREIDARVDSRVAEQSRRGRDADWGSVTLGLGSMGIGFAVTEKAFTLLGDGVALLAAVAIWGAIVAVNALYLKRPRP